MTRIRQWLAATHSSQFELIRHFLGDFFASDLVTSSDHWKRFFIGIVSVLLSAGILVLPSFMHRYDCLEADGPSPFCPALTDYHAAYLHLVHTDTLWLIGLAFCVTGMVTAIQWQSLFPTLRDRLALASLPVSPLEIFWSKLAAITAGFVGLLLAMNLPPSLLFAWVISGRWQQLPNGAQAVAIFGSMSSACIFMFFAALGIQGVLLNLLPPRLFERVSVYVQALLFTANVAALPFAWRDQPPSWWPPAWFLGRSGFYLAGLAALFAILTYLASYHRYDRLLMEAPGAKARKGWSWPAWLTLRDPHEQAMFSFLWKTLTRSRIHRLMLQIWAGLAIAWMIGAGNLRSKDSLPVVLVPLTASIFLIAGERYLFGLPSELRANWLFQIAESEGRVAWLRAVDVFVIGCGLVPVYLCSLAPAIAVFGFGQALRVSALGFFLALLVFEFLFRDWDKAPFTCSYLPGKRQMCQLLISSLYALSYIGTASLIVQAFSTGWVMFSAAFPLLFGAWRWLHRRRTADWPDTPLTYDDQLEPAVLPLQIGFERGSLGTIQRSAEPQVTYSTFWDVREVDDSRAPAPFFSPAGLFDDFRYGLRLVRKNFGLAATVVATLALGIGMNVSVFTLLNAVAFRARVPDPASFVRVSPVHTGEGGASVGLVTSDEYLIYRDRVRSLRSLAASSRTMVTLENDRSTGVPALLVSCNFFAVFGSDRPRAGRFFRPDECATAGQPPVAVISEQAWRDRFGSDSGIVGRTVSLDDEAFTIVGVAPTGTVGSENAADVWIPYTAQPILDRGADLFAKKSSWLWLDGRLAPGFSRSAVQAELAVLARQLDSEHPGRITSLFVTDGSLLGMQPIMRGAGASAFAGYWIMLFISLALGMVLCITCANVMTLLLSRAVGRRKEIAVRLSLGAPRMRLLRMLLMEGFLLASISGAISLYLSYHVPGLLYAFLAHRRADFPLDPDWRIFGYVFGVAVAAGCFSALAPALESLKVDLTASLKGSSATGDGTGGRLRTVLVSSQVALSLALLVGAGMFLRGYWTMVTANPGYETRHVLVAPLRYPSGGSSESSRFLVQDVLTRLQAVPGVSSAARSNAVPFLQVSNTTADFRDRGIQSARQIALQDAAPDVLGTLGVPILRGRDFRDSDRPSQSPVRRAIVSERLARELSPGRDPIGRVLELVAGNSYEVIGIAHDVSAPFTDNPVAYVFDGWDPRQTCLIVRFSGDTKATKEAVRFAVRGVRSDLFVMPQTLQERIDVSFEDVGRVVVLILILGLTAMTLSVAGIYGVISFTVTQKTRELGIRLALGAQKADIFREVLISGARPVLLGLFIGLWIALAAEETVRDIFSSSPVRLDAADPVVYAGAALVLAAAALTAMFFPARRGAGSDPMKSLHYE